MCAPQTAYLSARCDKVRGASSPCAGPLDFALTGVMASLVSPLPGAGVSIFAIATYDTDYVLARATDVGPDLRGFT